MLFAATKTAQIQYILRGYLVVAGGSRLGDRKNLEKTGRQSEKKKEEQRKSRLRHPGH